MGLMIAEKRGNYLNLKQLNVNTKYTFSAINNVYYLERGDKFERFNIYYFYDE